MMYTLIERSSGENQEVDGILISSLSVYNGKNPSLLISKKITHHMIFDNFTLKMSFLQVIEFHKKLTTY